MRGKMRKGQNPAKFVNTVAKPSNVTVAVLSYIPYQSGFYANSQEVLETCLKSIRNESQIDFDLLVFDNGSCENVQKYLLSEKTKGNIQFLFLSEKNLGKGGAWNIIFDAAPGEIIAYADSDIYFHKDWLSKSKEILDCYPNVGMVTARPYITDQKFNTNTLAWGNSNEDVITESGKLLSWENISSFLLSLGRTEEEIKNEFESNDVSRLIYKGKEAIVGASHWQFLTKKETIKQFLPFDMSRPMGQVNRLDQRMNEEHFLRLMTPEVLVDNLSNTLDKNSFESIKNKKIKQKKFIYKLLDLPFVKPVLLFIHHRIFLAYFDR
jgi:glycosyltransferase involved in cell wall biosynthesis